MSSKLRSLKQSFLLIVLLSSIPFLLAANILTFSILRLAREQLYSQIEQTTRTLNDTIESLLRSNIQTYLRSKIEVGLDIIEKIKKNPETNRLSLNEKSLLIIKELNSLSVGETGYFYAINTSGVMIFHPDKNLVGSDLHLQTPLKEQMEKRYGYFEYVWQNTYEETLRRKALYMTYLPELDWILTATSYRQEFTDMIDTESVKETVKSIRVGKSGYSYIANSSGEIIAHPLYAEGSSDIMIEQDNFKILMEKLFTLEEGYTKYMWRDSPDKKLRQKIVYGKYIEDFDWIVGTSMYEDEITKPITIIFTITLVFTAIVSALLFFTVRKISRTIEYPISLLHQTLDEAIHGNLGVRVKSSGPVEVQELGDNLNIFIGNLELKTKDLAASLHQKELLIHEIQHRVKNNLQTIISLLNLQADFSDNPDSRRDLMSAGNKVSVMALVYDHILLEDSDFSKDELFMPDFLKAYISSILPAYKIDYSKVKLVTDFKPISLMRNTTISLGLILNELMTNSLSCLLNEDTPLLIKISLNRIDADYLSLSIEDNRSSFNPAKWNRELNQTSYILVEVLTQQLRGRRETRNISPNIYTIKFPASG
ncbi:MAG: cache domain-containing protein [Spirochaetales bacterium]|nr:cache domain-containing protein [Spirochaetales bacterium]